MICGLCGSGMIGEEKIKKLTNGTEGRYIYYGCSRARDRQCKNTYIREDELIKRLIGLIDSLDIDRLGLKKKLESEVARFNKFQHLTHTNDDTADFPKLNIKVYAKYLLQEGSSDEKQELLALLKSKILITDRQITLAN
jgi:hypothetical protein